MPAGVSWGQYFRFMVASFLSMAAGSQVVHLLYRPLEGLDDLIKEREAEIQQLLENNKSTNPNAK